MHGFQPATKMINLGNRIHLVTRDTKQSVTLGNKTLTLRAVPGWSNPPVTRAVEEPGFRGPVTMNSHFVQVPLVPGSFR